MAQPDCHGPAHERQGDGDTQVQDEPELRGERDGEFGFRDGTLALFQIRPFVESVRARRSEYLAAMDQPTQTLSDLGVDLKQLPLTETAP